MGQYTVGIIVAITTFLFGSGFGFTVGVLNNDLFDVGQPNHHMHRLADGTLVGE